MTLRIYGCKKIYQIIYKWKNVDPHNIEWNIIMCTSL